MRHDKWYSYSGFKFSRAQIKWALSYLPMLRDGQWPTSHKESGYVGEAHNKRVSHEGSFVKAASIAAELDVRIQAAGLDGLLLELLYSSDPDDEPLLINHIAYCLRYDVREVSQRIRNALYFVSGANRKAGSYNKYVRDNYKYLRMI